ncbi:MAG: hypothetical protein IIZ54_11185 [Selenomonadaceae bacterium]|nr:hypothetical protein [Selenomonadaceae bacterium]
MASQSHPASSPTAYDDSFRTMLNDCKELVIPVVNEAFGESYTGKEKIIFGINEHFLAQDGGNEEKRITDSSFVIVCADGAKKRYHLECESNLDGSILLRIFEYDAQIALDDGKVDGCTLTVSFPHSAVLALRHKPSAPDTMQIRVVTPGGETSYTVPIIKVQQYSLEDIFDKKLLFFLPFYIFSHETDLPECAKDETKLEMLKDEYRRIRTRLDEMQKAGEITEFMKSAICTMTNHVLALIAEKYQNVREGVSYIMGGKVLEYEAKTILREGLNKGINIGRNEERQKAMTETEERAKDMLRDSMELSLVEKYTHLSMPRIKELARGLGML